MHTQIHQQVESDHPGQLGTSKSTEFQDRNPPEPNTNHGLLSQRRMRSACRKRFKAYTRLTDVPSTKKRIAGRETCNKPEKAKQISEDHALQDERLSRTESWHMKHLLIRDGQEACLFSWVPMVMKDKFLQL